MKKALLTIVILGLTFSFGYCQITGQSLTDTAKYEDLFKEYIDLIGKPARGKDLNEIEKFSQQFVEKNKNFEIAEIDVWNWDADLKTGNSLLFRKVYLKSNTQSGTLVYPEYKRISEIVIQELQQENQRFILMSYYAYPIECRMVIFINSEEAKPITKDEAIQLVKDYIKKNNISVIDINTPLKVSEENEKWDVVYEYKRDYVAIPLPWHEFIIDKKTGKILRLLQE